MDLLTAFLILTTLALAVLLAWSKIEKKFADAPLLASKDQKIEGLEEQISQLKEAEVVHIELNCKNNERILELEKLAVSLEEKNRSASEKLQMQEQQFNHMQEQFKLELKTLWNEEIKQSQHSLSQHNKEGLGTLLSPLKDQIDQFQQRMNRVHTESVQGREQLRSEIRTEIKNLAGLGQSMYEEAANLTKALKGSVQMQGAWGEAQLERTLEFSGLHLGQHYQKQASHSDEDGRLKRTDYIITLPGEKHIIIDSKVSLLAYVQLTQATTEQSRAQALKEHLNSIRNHIKELSSKRYQHLSELHSPEFVLMYMPIESAYIEALKADPNLFLYAWEKQIALVSHTTLVPILRTVANLWKLEKSSSEARKLAGKAADIYNSVRLVAEHLEKLGKNLQSTSKNYNLAIASISGRGGLSKKVEDFASLSQKVDKSIPELEPTHIEYDISKLSAIAYAPEQRDQRHNTPSDDEHKS